MQAVLIAMTILGCNDAVTQCNYVATVEKRWETVAMCDGDSERQLTRYSNIKYPTVIAVCEPPRPPEPSVVAAAPAPVPAVVEERPQTGISGLGSRMAAEVRAYLPSGHSMKSALATPVHFVSGSYSWVIRRLSNQS
ncbi:hypothetical protein [Rhizobium metallidurans]|uniref:Uncharacterized protein n=1 Tax=Rhizobium metallidurans TaxID=1265931 RepID=A0A7W6GBA3_9HYPH|nr:hypothetical protein [Rhizobium metallidurans]MBB3964584.1 hypothetical protein [Rhizobium metallidurans]